MFANLFYYAFVWFYQNDKTKLNIIWIRCWNFNQKYNLYKKGAVVI